MDFVLDNKISVDSLLTIVLAIVFIIQTAFLIRQTNFGVRSNQADLLETKQKEFENIKIDLLIKNPNKIPDENEFKKLVKAFNKIRPLFQSKLLKPSDFAYTFIALDGATGSEALRKTSTYKEEYLSLQRIYSHFNKDYDMIDYMLSLPKTSWYDKTFQKVSILQKHENLRKQMLENMVRSQKAVKVSVMLNSVILHRPLFKLNPPL